MMGAILVAQLEASDNLFYTFCRCNGPSGEIAYKRLDGDYWITFRPGFGWVAWDDATESCMGRPWDKLADEQRSFPPEGVWVSRKGRKSYVYDLVYILAPHTSA